MSQLYYADRLYELQLAMVGIALSVVLLPEVCRHLAAATRRRPMESQNRSAEHAMLLTVAAAAALMVIPRPIVSVFFERGAFTKTETMATSMALAIFAAGLPSFVLIKVFTPAYFARNDTKTPMLYAGVSLSANTMGSIALFFLFRAQGILPQLGIALATMLGGWISAFLLWRTLAMRNQFVAEDCCRALSRERQRTITIDDLAPGDRQADGIRLSSFPLAEAEGARHRRIDVPHQNQL